MIEGAEGRGGMPESDETMCRGRIGDKRVSSSWGGEEERGQRW